MKTNRPVIKLRPGNAEKAMDWIAILALLVLWAITVYQYGSLPPRIPVHFNFKGEIDSYANKTTLFILPAVVTIVVLGLTLLNTRPDLFNYPRKISPENAEREYKTATRLIRIIKLVISVFSVIVIIELIRSAKAGHSTLKWWSIPAFILAIVVPIIVSLFSRRIFPGKKN